MTNKPSTNLATNDSVPRVLHLKRLSSEVCPIIEVLADLITLVTCSHQVYVKHQVAPRCSCGDRFRVWKYILEHIVMNNLMADLEINISIYSIL